METCDDTCVVEVLEFTVLEELADEFDESEITKYMGPETKMAYKQISKYIKNNYIGNITYKGNIW